MYVKKTEINGASRLPFREIPIVEYKIKSNIRRNVAVDTSIIKLIN